MSFFRNDYARALLSIVIRQAFTRDNYVGAMHIVSTLYMYMLW